MISSRFSFFTALALAACFSTSYAAHADTIKLCYRVVGNADSAIPVNDRSTTRDRYGRGDCPSGMKAGSGTIFMSWPHATKNRKECIDYSGCKWAGLFSSVWANDGSRCRSPAEMLFNPLGQEKKCRFPKNVVRRWKVAATWSRRKDILNKKIRVWVQEGRSGSVPGRYLGEFNVVDTCGDDDCGGCCRSNTADGKYPLIDMEVMAYCQTGNCNPDDFNIGNHGYSRNDRPV